MDRDAQLLSDALQSLGFDPRTCRVQGAGSLTWCVKADGVVLALTIEDREGKRMLRIDSPVAYMPVQDLLPFYRRLLDLNRKLTGTAFAMDKDVVHLGGQQALEGMDAATTARWIQESIRSADALGDLLVKDFPSARYWTPM